ncbi:MAG: hypothetical protein ACPG4T_19705 [Nannocystaceae bacterium]
MYRPLLLASALLVFAGSSCRPTNVEAPYSVANAPKAQTLLAAATPKFSQIRVPAAKVRVGRSIAGNLMLLAQQPTRFTGQIQVAGKELISLAFHEQGYTLRYLAGEGLPTGFYAGPPSDCAVRQLVGVPLSPQALVDLVLGGLPIPEGRQEILSQGWDPKRGHEVLHIGVGTIELQLRFAWHGGAWWPAGASQWRRIQGGAKLWDWTIDHTDLHLVAGNYLPQKTYITRPIGHGKTQKVSIKYREVLPGSAPTPDQPANDSWGDDDGWDNDDEGWESEGESDDSGAWETAGDEPAPPPAVQQTAPSVIPPEFTLTRGSLPMRGDICARH